MKIRTIFLIVFLFFELLFILTFINNNKDKLLNQSNTHYDEIFEKEELSSHIGLTKDNCFYIDNNISNESVVFTFGPYCTLARGEYEAIITYKTDTNDNKIRPYSNTAKDLSGELFLEADKNTMSLKFFLNEDVKDFEVQSIYNGTGTFEIEKIQIKSTSEIWGNSQTVNILYLLFLIVCSLIFNVLFWNIFKTRENGINYLILLFVAIFISSPIFINGLISGHDLSIHIGRIYGIRDGLINGNFFTKIQANWLNDNGYAIGLFYGDRLLYLPAMFNLFGLNMVTSYKLFIFLINLATLFVSYYSLKEMFGEKLGLVGSILYSANLYRLMDIYLRHSVGEYCALLFLPLVVCGFYKIFKGEKHNNGWILLSIGLWGLINTHILSCEMAAIFVLLFLILAIFSWNKNIILNGILTFFTTICLSADFLIPFLEAMFTEKVKVADASRNDFSLQDRGLTITQLFDIFPNTEGSNLPYTAGITNEMPLTLGISLILGLVLGIITLFKISKLKEGKILLLYLVLSVVSLAMTTIYFPWDKIREIDILENAISSIQFPWRFLSIASIMLVLCICESIKLLEKNKVFISSNIITFLLIVCVISSGFYLNNSSRRTDFLRVNNKSDINFMITGEEYLPLDTNVNLMDDTYSILNGNVKVLTYSKNGTDIYLRVIAEENSVIELPLLYYHNYVAKTKHNNLLVSKSEHNQVQIEIPKGEFAIDIGYEPPTHWKVCYIISVVSWIIFILYGSYYVLLETNRNKLKQILFK